MWRCVDTLDALEVGSWKLEVGSGWRSQQPVRTCADFCSGSCLVQKSEKVVLCSHYSSAFTYYHVFCMYEHQSTIMDKIYSNNKVNN